MVLCYSYMLSMVTRHEAPEWLAWRYRAMLLDSNPSMSQNTAIIIKIDSDLTQVLGAR